MRSNKRDYKKYRSTRRAAALFVKTARSNEKAHLR